MTRDEVKAVLNGTILGVTGNPGPFFEETPVAAITEDSLDTIELVIALEIRFDRTFEDTVDAPIHAGTYGDLLNFLCRAIGVVEQSGTYGDMGVPGDNHWDSSKRGFQPK